MTRQFRFKKKPMQEWEKEPMTLKELLTHLPINDNIIVNCAYKAIYDGKVKKFNERDYLHYRIDTYTYSERLREHIVWLKAN